MKKISDALISESFTAPMRYFRLYAMSFKMFADIW